MERTKGTITRLMRDKGFGFIADGPTEYFFHRSACSGEPFDHLQEGQMVTFEAAQAARGPRAEHVRIE